MLSSFRLALVFFAIASNFEAMAAGGKVKVTSAEFGVNWPLTIQYGDLGCYQLNNTAMTAVVFITPTATYAVNGTANSHAKTQGWQNIRPIWRDNPAIPGTKIPITPLINKGLTLCK